MQHIEMIIDYVTDGTDYQYCDNHGVLIRCKDCKHSEHWYRDKRRCFLWAESGIDVFDDGFCNYAERGQDEQS